MGLHVAAIDVSNEKLDLAKSLGAELTVNAREQDPGQRDLPYMKSYGFATANTSPATMACSIPYTNQHSTITTVISRELKVIHMTGNKAMFAGLNKFSPPHRLTHSGSHLLIQSFFVWKLALPGA
jgi:D-arabinose 1-dehydrogenase-like Zn-dependent alcohol dehydrogenase